MSPHLCRKVLDQTLLCSLRCKEKEKVTFVSLHGKILNHMHNEDYLSEYYLSGEKTMKRMNQDVETVHDKSRSRSFYQLFKNWAALTKIIRLIFSETFPISKENTYNKIQNPDEPQSIEVQKQPKPQPMEKVLIGVKEKFKIYRINIPEL